MPSAACPSILASGKHFGKTARTTTVRLVSSLPFTCLTPLSFPALNPDPRNPPLLDLKDQALLLDPAGSTADFGRHYGHGHHVGTPPVTPHVSWLRKTEYISRDGSAPAPRAAAADMFVPSFHLSSFSHVYNHSFFFGNSLAERTCRMTWWTFRATLNSRPSRTPLLQHAAQNSLVHCGTRPNRVCAPSRPSRYSPTRTYGRTHTTCSGSVSGRASVDPRYVCAFPFLYCG
jgi:hypothetical protein